MGTYHLFFDLDGTLTDPAPGITACLTYAVERLGGAPLSEAELRQYIGPPLRDTFAEVLRTRDSGVIEEAVKLYRERFSAVGLYENCVYPGIPRALAHLSTEGFSMSVVTSKPDVYANRILDHFELRKFFSGVHGAELSGKRSEKSELVAHALVSEGAQPRRTCMIGDRRLDVVGARTHGLSTVGVAWGYGAAEELRDAGADWVIHTVEELVPACVESRMSERDGTSLPVLDPSGRSELS